MLHSDKWQKRFSLCHFKFLYHALRQLTLKEVVVSFAIVIRWIQYVSNRSWRAVSWTQAHHSIVEIRDPFKSFCIHPVCRLKEYGGSPSCCGEGTTYKVETFGY